MPRRVVVDLVIPAAAGGAQRSRSLASIHGRAQALASDASSRPLAVGWRRGARCPINRALEAVSMALDVSEVILAKSRAGALPAPDRSIMSYAGKGTNKTCDGCDGPLRQRSVLHHLAGRRREAL